MPINFLCPECQITVLALWDISFGGVVVFRHYDGDGNQCAGSDIVRYGTPVNVASTN
jgi:hypothetical protein